MAKEYGCRPSELLNASLGDFALDWACYEKFLEHQKLNNPSLRSDAPPEWAG